MHNPVYRNYLKPLIPYFRPNIKELVLNKPCELWLEDDKGEWQVVKDKKLNLTWAEGMSQSMASYSGQRFDHANPTLSFKVPKIGDKKGEEGGHRVQIFYGSTTKNDIAIAIRLYRGIIYSTDDFDLSESTKAKIIKAVQEKKNIIISGGTGTGKTSFLNTLFSYVEEKERIITIEGVSELIVPQPNHCSLFYSENKTSSNNKTVADLLNDTLRMRPDRIIMGELRKENSYVFSRAINTGHAGSMATIHANAPEEALEAIVDNVIMNGDAAVGSIDVFTKQLRKRITGVIQLEREGGRVKGYFEYIK
jgi:type IV secretion system protein VirB11